MMAHNQYTTGTCKHPFHFTGDSLLNNYTQPAVPLTVVSLGCPPGLFLSGQDKLLCSEQGEWTPDPRRVDCHASEDFTSGGNF